MSLLTVLNYSGGSQSQCLAWMVTSGEIPMPDPFLILMADTGGENVLTYRGQQSFFHAMELEGIPVKLVQGRNLVHDLTALDGTQTRIDNPPFWIKKPGGGKGKLKQKCTGKYKVQPMDQYIRQLLWEKHGIHPRAGRGLGEGLVEKWIGFAADEGRRAEKTMRSTKQRYIRFRFPLIELGMTKADVSEWYRRKMIEEPPRSLCNFCFAYGLKDLKRMHDERPRDWDQAVAVDRAIRHGLPKVEGEAFVSQTLIPLEELARRNFLQDEKVAERLLEEICDTF